MYKIKVSRNFVLINEEIKTSYAYKDTYFPGLRLKSLMKVIWLLYFDKELLS